MSVSTNSADKPSTVETDVNNFNPTHLVADELYSLVDAVDIESIANDFGIAIHNKKHDFKSHLKVVIREALDPSSSLAELEDKTAVDDSLEKISKSRFSVLTNDRDYRAVVQVLFALLHTPQLYRQRAVQRKRLEWLLRPVVALDATNLELTRSVVVSEEFLADGDQPYQIDPSDGGIRLHLAARVDGEGKHPLGATVTEANTHESPQFDHLADDVEVFEDLESIIWTFDRGYTKYVRFCKIKRSEDDFVALLESNANVDVVEQLEEYAVTTKPLEDENSGQEQTHHVRDDLIELSDTGEHFRRITLKKPDGEVLEYLTTLSPEEYTPVEVISIYTLRTLIEILFREFKQYLNIENFHSKSLNGVLFELFCALIAYVLIEWFRQRHPVKGGVARAIQKVRTYWNQTLDSFG